MDPVFIIPAVPILVSAGAYILAMIQGATDELEDLPQAEKPLPLVPKALADVRSLAASEPQKELEVRKAHSVTLPRETSSLLAKTSKRVDDALNYFTEVAPHGDEVRELKVLEARLLENVDALRKSVPFGESQAPAAEEALFAENIQIINNTAYRLAAGKVTLGQKGLRTLNNYLRSKESLALAAETRAEPTKDLRGSGSKSPWWQPRKAISSR